MAVLASIATGNLTSASTWGLVDSTSYLNAENATESLLTTAYSDTRSAGFTPGAITVSHIGVKLCERIGTTGTMSVELYNNTGAAAVAGTEVTIDVADLPSALEAQLNGGWIFFKLASPVTLSAATSYSVEAKTSSSTQVDLWCDATVDNIARALITTTTQAPVAGDDMIIAGEYVDASTFNTFVVTMNETATTDYGAASTSLVTPAIAICNGGTLQYGTTAATNYYLRVSGNIIIYSGGIFNIGTTGTPIPRDSTASLNFDCAAHNDFGLTIRGGGTLNVQGLSRTSGKNIVRCKLNTDEAANSTSLGVDTDTGWLDNDEIVVLSTTRTRTETEKGALNGNAGASSLTVDGFAGTGGGLAFAHEGTAPVQAEIGLLTRNIKIFGVSTAFTFIVSRHVSFVDIDWASIYYAGSSGSAAFRGITTAGGSISVQYSSIYDCNANSAIAAQITGDVDYVFSHNIVYNCVNQAFSAANGSATGVVVDDNIFAYNNGSSQILVDIVHKGITFTNNVASSGMSAGIRFSSSGSAAYVLVSDNVSHSNASNGFMFNTADNGAVYTNLTAYRNNDTGFSIQQALSNVIFDSCVAFGNATASFTLNNSTSSALGGAKFINFISNGDTTFSTGTGFSFVASNMSYIVEFINCEFGVASGIYTAHTQDISVTGAFIQAKFINSIMASGTEVLNQANMIGPDSFVSSQRHDQTAGNHKTWKKYGTITIDTTANMYRTASPSERLTPNNASNKLASGAKKVPVGNGQTVTINAYVRESVVGDGTDYNGNRPRLVLKRNDAMGISTDTVIDTATASAEGAFELLTGTTAAVTDSGVLEFYVDCDGTTGWVNVDDWSATLA